MKTVKHLYLLVALVLVLAMGMGCGGGGGGGSSSGGGSSQTFVGTWNRVSSDDPTWLPQFTFNANNTGRDSNMDTFTWTQTGNQLTINWGGGFLLTWTYVNSADGNTSTWKAANSTAVYRRA